MNLGLTELQLLKIQHRLAHVGIELHLDQAGRKDTFSKTALIDSDKRYIELLGFIDACEPAPVYPDGITFVDKMALDLQRDKLIANKVEAICWQIDHILEDKSLKSAERQAAELFIEKVPRNKIAKVFDFSSSKLNRILKRRIDVRDKYQ